MQHRSPRRGRLAGAALALACLAGCVERRMVIITDPPHAVVVDERNQPIGASPVDRTFTYYGRYRFRLVKDGYETLVIEENVRPPWYEYFPLDFISENLLPFHLRDVRYFRYTLKPAQVVSPDAVLQEAEQLRVRGRTTGAPLPAAPAGVAPPPAGFVPPGVAPPAGVVPPGFAPPGAVPPPPPVPDGVPAPRPMPGP